MPWEFQRSAPSDNVMVPATSDPFESPKWAPPVWHMPPALVLLVNLVRSLGGLVGLAVRHPITTTVVGVLGWLTYVVGWPVLVWLAVLGILGLGGWAVASWPSFLRLVLRPARARWRYLTVYRRNWRPVMVMSGLAFYRNAREYLPTIKRVEVTRTTDRVLVKMLSGQAPSIWEDHVVNLAHGFGSTSCRVRTARRAGRFRRKVPARDWPGHLWLEFVRRDALAAPLAALPVAQREDVDLTRLPVGRREDSSPWLLRLLGTHVLIAGATGAGKGSVLWSLIRAMLPAMRAGLVQGDPRKDVINIRNLFPTRIALRLDEAEQVDMVLGDGAYDRGALADQISPLPEVGAGVGYVRLEDSPDPVRVRAGFVSDHDIAAMAAYLKAEAA